MTVNSDNSVDLKWKTGTVYHFVPISFQIGSLLASIRDLNGNVVVLTYPSGSNQITQITDPVGRSFNLSYDGANRITSINDSTGRSVQYTYNSAGYLSTFTDANGGATTYGYDAQNNLTSVKNAMGL